LFWPRWLGYHKLNNYLLPSGGPDEKDGSCFFRNLSVCFAER
jgi:hypothetical protein